MRISYIINTAASDPWVHGGNPHRQAAYRSRQALLRDKVLPAALEQGFDEIIVAGVYESGSNYRYLPVVPRYRDRRDALVQREQGARHATGDILVFGHDDHMLGEGFCQTLRTNYSIGLDTGVTDLDNMPVYKAPPAWDLLIPRRLHAITGATLNNGFEDSPNKASYMGGHVLVMKRWLWAEVPWTACDTEYWDTSMTRLWTEAGGKLVFADDLIHLDVEAAENES